MGGPGSGGTRTGTPGTAYTNRSDLNKPSTSIPQTTTGQTYGTAKSQTDAQRAVPSTPPPSLAVPLTAPTERPNEPVTSGMTTGPGPGPEVLPQPTPDATSLQLRALYRLYPNNDLLSLLEFMDSGQRY